MAGVASSFSADHGSYAPNFAFFIELQRRATWPCKDLVEGNVRSVIDQLPSLGILTDDAACCALSYYFVRALNRVCKQLLWWPRETRLFPVHHLTFIEHP